MAEFALTPQQQAAVENRGGALLVSAAAGSGKTKVLVERLMHRICDPQQPCDLSAFLIITYTSAAASELRGKISAELNKRLAKDPSNRHLRRQMQLLYLTQISTVHAFCMALLKEYAYELDISPDFRVGDTQICKILQQRALEDVLDEAYAQLAHLPGMQMLLDILGSKRDDTSLESMILRIYEAAQSHPYPQAWLKQCHRMLELDDFQDAAQSVWGKYLVQNLQQVAAIQKQRIAKAIETISGYKVLKTNYLPAFQRMLEQLSALEACQTWDALSKLAKFDKGTLISVRKFEDPVLLQQLQEIRSDCAKKMEAALDPFQVSSAVVLAELQGSVEALQTLLVLVERFTEQYRLQRQRQGILDFSDLEHETIRLLTHEKTGKPTQTARCIAQRYQEIMVDEYQDSNAVQETIFEAISQAGKNRFFVGDVKQSIYSFRLAEPEMFLKKYQQFAHASTAAEGEPRKILLSQNFRSDPQILDAVNFVFSAVMSQQVGDLQYGAEERLQPPEGKQTALPNESAVEFYAIDTGKADRSGAEKVPKEEIEAQFVAAKIREMLEQNTLVWDGGELRPMRPKDVVILLRSVSTPAPYYVRALEKAGIPVVCDRGGDLFQTKEVAALVSLLQIIDNPRRDVPLLCVLQSPLVGFTSDELAQARLLHGSGDYYDALVAFAAQSEKAAGFLEQLRALRTFAAVQRIPQLLDTIWQQTHIAELYGILDGGSQRVHNLEAIYSLSLGFTGTLMEFLKKLETVREQGMAPPTEAAASDCVSIMTIHKSKGLEFPVVFLSDLARQFNMEDTKQPVLIHPQLGLGSYVMDQEQLVLYPTIARNAIVMAETSHQVSEELRVLYVAMTRPQSRLIMTLCKASLQSTVKKLAVEAALPAPLCLTAPVRALGDWILMAALCRVEAGELHAWERPAALYTGGFPWKIRALEKEDLPAPVEAPPWNSVAQAGTGMRLEVETLRESLGYRYPYLPDTVLPSKLTATQLKGRSLDEEAAEGTAPEPVLHTQLAKPRFHQEKRALTAAEKGTAMHLVMQFADYAQCRTQQGVCNELERLVEQAYITQQQADAVQPASITAFFASAIGQEVLAAENLLREFKFSLLVPARVYAPGGTGEILLQGVVDCCIVQEDGLILLDFKTDRVSAETVLERGESYRGQLAAYANALEKVLGRPVKRRILYFFAVGEAVELA